MGGGGGGQSKKKSQYKSLRAERAAKLKMCMFSSISMLNLMVL